VLPTTPFFTRVRTRTTTSRPVTNWWDVPIQHNDLYSYHGLGSYATSEHHAESSAIRPLPFYATFLMAIKQVFNKYLLSMLIVSCCSFFTPPTSLVFRMKPPYFMSKLNVCDYNEVKTLYQGPLISFSNILLISIPLERQIHELTRTSE